MNDLTSRPDWDVWFMRLAYVTASRGSCRRKKVGALVVRDKDKRIISGGYNGAPRGLDDCLKAGCKLKMVDGRESCVRTLHAESNALDLAGTLTGAHTIYTTVIPCYNCAMRIIQAGIKTVVYCEHYASQMTKDGVELFNTPGEINVRRTEQAGVVVRDPVVKLRHLDITDTSVNPVAIAQHINLLIEEIKPMLTTSAEGAEHPLNRLAIIASSWLSAPSYAHG